MYELRSNEASTKRKLVIVVFGFVETLLFSGTAFGWPSLVPILKADGLYGPSTCVEDQDEECQAQDRTLDTIFTCAVISKGAPSLIFGLLLNKVGLRFVRLIYICFVMCGMLCIAFASPEQPGWLYPGMVLMALGGTAIRQSSVQLANLFPTMKSTIISAYSGAMCTSAAVFLMIKILCDAGVSRKWCFVGLSILAALSFIPTLVMLPVRKITADVDGEEKISSSEEPLLDVAGVEKSKSVWDSLLSPTFVLHVYWMFSTAICVVVLQGYVNAWVDKIHPQGYKASRFIDIFGYTTISMVFLSPLVGLVMDYKTSKANEERDAKRRALKLVRASVVTLLATSIVATSLAVSLFFDCDEAVYVGIASITLLRPMQNATCIAHIRHRFKEEHVDVLVGVALFVGNILLLLEHVWFMYLQEEDNSKAVVALTVVVILGYSNPLQLLRVEK